MPRRPHAPDERQPPHGPQRKLAELQVLLHAELAALFSGEDWTRLLRMAAELPGQSFTNVVLIGAQRAGTTMAAGYEAWQAMGRQVVKGEPGIRVIAERDGDSCRVTLGVARFRGSGSLDMRDE